MERVQIFFHGGASTVAHVGDDDLEAEGERVREAGVAYADMADPQNAEELVEMAITIPPKPRWTWIGDTLIFTQAVCGIACGDGRE